MAIAAFALNSGGRGDDISGYRSWTKVNVEPMYMLPKVSTLCVQQPHHAPSNPHASRYFTVYVNEIGRPAMGVAGSIFPVGTIIVKEKFASGEGKLLTDKPELLTVMIKREQGFNRECGDWEFRTASGDGVYATKEDVAHCVSCHAGRPKSDFTFRTYVGK
jgi:hypothetical protein